MITLDIDKNLKIEIWNALLHLSIANRGKGDGTQEQQYVGLLGEYTVKSLLGIDHIELNGFDGGYDLTINGRKVDIKTMGRTVDPQPHYVNNFIAYQQDFDCDFYIFCSLNKEKSTVTICGYQDKKTLLEVADFFPEGSTRYRDDGTKFKMKAPTYEIKNQDLKPINKPEDLWRLQDQS